MGELKPKRGKNFSIHPSEWLRLSSYLSTVGLIGVVIADASLPLYP